MSQTTRAALAELRRQSGRQYPALEGAIEAMTEEARRDLLRLFRDLEADASQKARQAAMQPWRQGR